MIKCLSLLGEHTFQPGWRAAPHILSCAGEKGLPGKIARNSAAGREFSQLTVAPSGATLCREVTADEESSSHNSARSVRRYSKHICVA
jgi:hypothetical protein